MRLALFGTRRLNKEQTNTWKFHGVIYVRCEENVPNRAIQHAVGQLGRQCTALYRGVQVKVKRTLIKNIIQRILSQIVLLDSFQLGDSMCDIMKRTHWVWSLKNKTRVGMYDHVCMTSMTMVSKAPSYSKILLL